MGKKKTIGAHQERGSPLLNKIRKGRIDLALATCIQEQQADPKSTRRNLHLFRFGLGINGIGWVSEITDQGGCRHQFDEKLKALRGYLGQREVDAREISARPVETVDEVDLDRVRALHKNNRDGLGRSFGCKRTICALQYNDCRYSIVNQFRD